MTAVQRDGYTFRQNVITNVVDGLLEGSLVWHVGFCLIGVMKNLTLNYKDKQKMGLASDKSKKSTPKNDFCLFSFICLIQNE
jgi:hypothetical protein